MNAKSSSSLPHITLNEQFSERFSYVWLLFVIVISIFLAEVVAMALIRMLPPSLPYLYLTLIDAGIMIALVFPILYYFSYRPLLLHINKGHQAEKTARAERQRFYDILETLPGYLVLLTSDYHVPFANRFFRERFGDAQGQRCYEYLFGRDKPCEVCETYNVLKTMKPGRWEWTGPDHRIYDVYDFPFTDTDGSTSILEMGIDITDQKQAQAQIHEMALFPALNPDGVLQVDASGQIKKLNPAAIQMGFSVGSNLTELIPELRELDLPACIAAGTTQHIQREAHVGSRILLWSVRGAPDLGLAFLYSKDITLHRHVEEAVRQLSRVVEQTEDIVVVTNCDGVIEYVNPSFERLTGYTKEETLGKTPRIIKSSLYDKEYYQNLWNSILAGEIYQGEIANRKKNGELYHEMKTITPLRDMQGKITHFVATGKDITQHKLDEEKLRRAYDELELHVQERTEELRIANSELEDEIRVRRQVESALRQSEQRLSRAQEIAHLGSWELELANNQLNWSDEVYRIFGLQPQEFEATYEAFLAAVHPEDRAAVDEAYSSSIREGRDSYEIEHRIVKHSSGEIRTVHEKCEHFRDETGQIIRSVGMVHDITERKQVQEKLYQLNRTLKALNRSNQAMLRSRSETELLNEVCNIIVEDCGHAMVWIGFKEKDEQHSVRPVASAGFEEGYLETLQISWADTERGRGPTGTAIRTGESMRCRNMLTDPEFIPWREQALKRGYSSSIALPLKDEDSILGAITIYSCQPDSFTDEEEELLKELAGDLAYGITALRLRAAHAQAEEALRRNEALLSQTGEMAKVGGWELEVPTMTLLWSQETYRIHGVDPSIQPSVENAIDFYAPEARDMITEAVSQAIQAGQPYDLELPFITASGKHLWIRTMGQPEFRDGTCVRLFGAFQDITERKQAEEALRKAHDELEQRVAELQTLMNVAPVGIAIGHDRGSRLITGNHLLSEWLGTPEQTNISLSTHREERQVQYTVFREGKPVCVEDLPVQYATLNAQGRRNDELTIVREDGKTIELLANAEPLFDHQGQVRGAIATFSDITARKQAEAALRTAHGELELRVQERTQELVKEITERKEVEKQLRIRTTAMEAAANGIIITTPQGDIQWTNPALLQITGYDSHELLGQSMRIFNSGTQNTDYYHRMWATILSGQVWRGEVTNRRKDGSLYTEEQTITPVRDESDQIHHFIAIKQDISERKRAEAEMAEWNIKLQALSIAEREQRQLSESLAEAALVLNKSMKLDEVLPLILQQVKAVIPYELATIMMFDGTSFYDASHAGDLKRSQDFSQVQNRFSLADFPLLAKIRQSHQPVVIADTRKETNWTIVPGLEWSRSILCVPLLAESQVIGFLNLLAEQPDFFTAQMRDRLVAFAAHAAIAIQNAWLFEQVRASNERLQSLSHRLVEIQENERLYIARELHDEAGQMLTSLMLDLVTLETQADQPQAVLKKAAEMEEMLNAVSENLHNVAMALRPASLDHLGLVPALRQYVDSMGERYKLRSSFTAGNFQERLPANMETELYRIVQEALTNVARHAHASQVDVILTLRDRKLIVMVEDDGSGFDPENIPDTGRLGLFGMRERAEMIGGQLIIESKPGKGTTVIVEVDYDSPIVDRG